jgi:hypothetical protein
MNRHLIALLVLLITTLSFQLHAETALVQVEEPFLNMHTGPGRGYPVFHAVEKGEWIEVLKRRTNWFKVRTQGEKEGWIKQSDLHLTLNIEGDDVSLSDGSFASFQQRRAEFSVLGGELESVSSLTVVGSWVFTENFAAELTYTQALGDFSENQIALIGIQHTTFPEWRLSPFFSLAGGQIRTTPRATLVQSGDESRTTEIISAGIGLRYYLARNFVMRVEYNNLLVLTERDEQEELDQWKLGFSVFF